MHLDIPEEERWEDIKRDGLEEDDESSSDDSEGSDLEEYLGPVPTRESLDLLHSYESWPAGTVPLEVYLDPDQVAVLREQYAVLAMINKLQEILKERVKVDEEKKEEQEEKADDSDRNDDPKPDGESTV